MHLDPDYDFLSYGDTAVRGAKLLRFVENDIVIFYSSLRSIYGGDRLIYALTGMLIIDSVRRVEDVHEDEYDHNAHTRLLNRNVTDIVIKGKRGLSGRFKKYIDIGEFRNGSYRVRKDLLEEWGDLSVKDGWIQRSANPPTFRNPKKFLHWLEKQNPEIVESNN